MNGRAGFVFGLLLGVMASGLLVSALELLSLVTHGALLKLQTFGEWLDTPAGGDFFWSVVVTAGFTFLVLGGARRG